MILHDCAEIGGIKKMQHDIASVKHITRYNIKFFEIIVQVGKNILVF